MNGIDSAMFQRMVLSAANQLENDRELIDRLNVFPVPDGDTGTNMNLTFRSAVEELKKSGAQDLGAMGKAVAKGSLMGARGNSGVILSQLLRGFSAAMEGKKFLTVADVTAGLTNAKTVAYKAVMKPVEGTILTVVRETGDFARLIQEEKLDMGEFLERVLEAAQRSLENTPNLLINLKEANVVDSGGRGFVSILEGMLKAWQGVPVEKKEDPATQKKKSYEELMEEDIHIFEGELDFGYCTEFMVVTDKTEVSELRFQLESMGDSMVIVGDDGFIKVHIHTNDPGLVLDKAGRYGNLDRIKIENMRLQYEQRIKANKQEEPPVEKLPEKELGIISVAIGDGMVRLMKDFNVDVVIEGGQTMNPSTEDFLTAIEKINAKSVIVLPNNSNIIMTANQTREMSDKNIYVVPTKTLPEAIVALMSANIAGEPQSIAEEMKEALTYVRSGEVTFAVRDTQAGKLKIRKGDIIGIQGKGILTKGNRVERVTMDLVKRMADEDSEVITLYYGNQVKPEEAESLKKKLEKLYPSKDIEIFQGNQPLYYYFISVE